METKAVFKGAIKNGVGNVAISSDAKKVAAISLEDERLLVVYDLEKNIQSKANPSKKSGDGIIVTGRLTLKPVFDLKFDKSGKTLIAACLNDIIFITFEGNSMKIAKGVWS